MRCRCPQGRGCRPERVLSRSGNGTTKENWAAGQIRIDGADPTSSRRLPKTCRQEARRIYVRRPAWPGTEYDNAAVLPARLRVDCQHWAGTAPFRHPLASANQGDSDAPAIYEPYSSCLATPKIESTVRYLGIEVDDALAIA